MQADGKAGWKNVSSSHKQNDEKSKYDGRHA
jgi:hypothetical protein